MKVASSNGRTFLCLSVWVYQYPGVGCNGRCVLFVFKNICSSNSHLLRYIDACKIPVSVGTFLSKRYTMKNNLIVMVCCLSFFALSCKKTSTEPEIPPTPTTPIVKIISLTNNAVVLDSVLIEVDATDDKGITKVEIYIDNKTDSSKTILLKPYKYIWRTPQTEDSSKHLLYAKAFDADGNATATEVLTINVRKFQSPSQLQILSMTTSQVNLIWTDNSSSETGFEIEQSANGGNYTLVKMVGANITTITITALFDSTTTYSFGV